jgi:hypothetical protein
MEMRAEKNIDLSKKKAYTCIASLFVYFDRKSALSSSWKKILKISVAEPDAQGASSC